MASTLDFVPRRVWGAKDVKEKVPRLKWPVNKVFYAFVLAGRYVGPKPGASEIECVEFMQRLQKWDIRRKRDIRFNFVIAPDGNIYRGRGWTSAPLLPHKLIPLSYTSLYIGYLGDFRNDIPDLDHLHLRRKIIRFGVENKYISEKFVEINLKHAVLETLLPELLQIN